MKCHAVGEPFPKVSSQKRRKKDLSSVVREDAAGHCGRVEMTWRGAQLHFHFLLVLGQCHPIGRVAEK